MPKAGDEEGMVSSVVGPGRDLNIGAVRGTRVGSGMVVLGARMCTPWVRSVCRLN